MIHRPTVVEVDHAALAHNVEALRAVSGGAALCAVVKADGYGHGMVEVARTALDAGASWLAVATVEEAQRLRAAGIDAPTLLLSEPPADEAAAVVDAGVRPAVYTSRFGAALDAAAKRAQTRVAVHLKADTGMHRVGVPPDRWDELLDAVAGWGSLDVEALWTHLARADEPDADTTPQQLAAFEDFTAAARDRGVAAPLRHAANSAATLVWPDARLDLVRTGIAMYGLSPSPEVDAADHGLRPALTLRTRVSFSKRIEAGASVSYGHRWSAPSDGWLATLPIGYADGVPRLLSNRGEVLIGGGRRPIAGSVCMDQILVWCGDDEVAIGDEAVLLGAQGPDRIRVEDWAAHAETITYEIVTNLADRRVPRRHVGTG